MAKDKERVTFTGGCVNDAKEMFVKLSNGVKVEFGVKKSGTPFVRIDWPDKSWKETSLDKKAGPPIPSTKDTPTADEIPAREMSRR